MEERATTGPPEGSASLTGTGAGRGVRVVLSRKKQREAPESNVKVCKASAGAAPTTTRGSTLRSRPTTTGPTASTAATPSAASTAATRASTVATSPTAATTSTASTSSTAAATTAPTATSTTTAASSTTPATLALAVAALHSKRSSTNVLRNRHACSSSRGEGGGKGGGGAPLKEG
ncbi:unnamed protein product [Closterium sp. NIES-54]